MKTFAILVPFLFILSSALHEDNKNEGLQENLQGGWLKIYDRYYGPAYSIIKTGDGYLMTCSNGILKVDWLGHIIWEKKGYEGDDVIEVEDGYVVAGFDAGPKGDLDATLMKISKDGKILWKRFYDSGKDYDHAESVVQARDGGYILVGKAAG
ncbi:MAG: hypothetical protein J7K61_05880, partial [Thermoplasmata archaeon]|nr:hypothetical protein [Thermoplasmata archaeon]